MLSAVDKLRDDLSAGEEAILSAAGIIKRPKHLTSSFLDGRFRDRRPSHTSFLIDDEEVDVVGAPQRI